MRQFIRCHKVKDAVFFGENGKIRSQFTYDYDSLLNFIKSHYSPIPFPFEDMHIRELLIDDY